MSAITFRAKVQTVYNHDDTVSYRYVQVPKIGKRHCDMPAFRKSARYGGFANSDLFPAMLARGLKDAGIHNQIRLDRLPANVTIDDSGFLALVRVELEDTK